MVSNKGKGGNLPKMRDICTATCKNRKPSGSGNAIYEITSIIFEVKKHFFTAICVDKCKIGYYNGQYIGCNLMENSMNASNCIK
jgi:hypothetical protein